MKRNSLKKQKLWYLIHTRSDIALKDAVVNRALPTLHWGSPEITLTKEKQKLDACLKIRRENELDADLRITKKLTF